MPKCVVSSNENDSNQGVMWPEWAMANFFHLQMHTGMPHMGASFILNWSNIMGLWLFVAVGMDKKVQINSTHYAYVASRLVNPGR